MELDRQLVRLKCQLVNRGYSTGTIKMYEQCWIHLRKIAQNMGIEEFNESLAKAFIDDRKKNQNFQKNEKKYLRCLEMIRFFLTNNDIPSHALRLEPLSAYYQSILDCYVNTAISLNQSKSTLKTKKSRIRKFLLYLESLSLDDIKLLTPDMLLNFMSLLNTNYSSSYTIGGILYSVRDFLHFCTINYDTPKKLGSMSIFETVFTRDLSNNFIHGISHCLIQVSGPDRLTLESKNEMGRFLFCVFLKVNKKS